MSVLLYSSIDTLLVGDMVRMPSSLLVRNGVQAYFDLVCCRLFDSPRKTAFW